MLPKSMFIILIVTMLVTMGCGFTFTIPVTDINTGPTVIEEIEVPVPEGVEIEPESQPCAGRPASVGEPLENVHVIRQREFHVCLLTGHRHYQVTGFFHRRRFVGYVVCASQY